MTRSRAAHLGVLLGLLPSLARAADVCVAPAASGRGDGSDWNNMRAWSDAPARGDVWLIADGEYSGKTLDVTESGATVITIRKATVDDHGPDAGWDDALGDGQATFASSILFESPHWVFDGRTGGGPGSWDAGFGFVVASDDDAVAVVRIGYENPADDVTVRHVELQGMGEVSDQGGGFSNDAVAIYGASDITISRAWIHGAGRCPFFIDTADSVFEYVWVESYFGSADVHSEIASIWSFADGPIGDITFRYNLFTHVVSTGGLMFDNSSNPDAHLFVYGNVFYQPPGAEWEQANGLIGGWTGGNGEEMHNVWVDHNTFVGIDQASLSTLPQVSSGSRAQNNLWVDSEPPSFDLFPTHDYNHFVSSGDAQGEANGTIGRGDPFTDVAVLDFTLVANTEPGLDLGAPFDVDGLGRTRATWTRGAFEFCEGPACDDAGTGTDGGSDDEGTSNVDDTGPSATDDGGSGEGGVDDGGTGTTTTAAGSDSDGGSAGSDDDGSGCACSSSPHASALAFGPLVLVFAWRRRALRRRIA